MSRTLRLDEMLVVIKVIDRGLYQALAGRVQAIAVEAADSITRVFGIVHDRPDMNLDELLVGFYATTADQDLPGPLAEFDIDGDWEMSS